MRYVSDRNRKWEIFALQTKLMERYAVAWLCRARLRPGAAAWVGVTLPVCDAATQSKVLFAYSSAFSSYLVVSKYEQKESKI